MVHTPTAVVVAVIDETGSMEMRKYETITGYNAYLAGLSESHVPIRFSAYKFDKFGTEPIVRPLDLGVLADQATRLNQQNYQPRGNTPLYDAIGHAIAEAGRLKSIYGANRVTVMIQTDGMENASREYNYETVKGLIADRKSMGWEFLFLAADLGTQAYHFSSSIGISRGQTMSYSSVNSHEMFDAAAQNTANFSSNATASVNFSAGQKAKAGDTFEPKANDPSTHTSGVSGGVKSAPTLGTKGK